MQIKRQDFLNEISEELMFRKAIRKGIAIVESRGNKEEKQLRKIIRNLIHEAKAGELKVHDTSAGNFLENLFSNTSFLTDLRDNYHSLTTSEEQRKSFRAHILNAMKALLARDMLNREEDDESKSVGTTLKATPETGFDINVTDSVTKKEKEQQIKEEEKFVLLPGMDQTGAEAAERTWKSLGPLITNELIIARDPRDRAQFEEYLYKNVVGYFEEWEESIISKQTKQPL